MNEQTNIMEIGLTAIDGEPKARDLDIADRLRFEDPLTIRKLVKRHAAELAGFGVISTVEKTSGKKGGRPAQEFWLNEAQTLYITAKSETETANAVLTMVIGVFVAWRRGHLPAVDQNKLARQIAAIVDAKLQRQTDEILNQMLPAAVSGYLAERNYLLRSGKTAKDIWDAHQLPPKMRGSTVWFGNRLKEMGAAIEFDGRFDRGNGAVRLFDPDKAEVFLRNGLLHRCKAYASERMGQGRLRLVGGEAV